MRLPVDENTNIYILDENFPIQRPYDDNFLTWFPCLAFLIAFFMCGIYCCTSSPCPNFRILLTLPGGSYRADFDGQEFSEDNRELKKESEVEDRGVLTGRDKYYD